MKPQAALFAATTGALYGTFNDPTPVPACPTHTRVNLAPTNASTPTVMRARWIAPTALVTDATTAISFQVAIADASAPGLPIKLGYSASYPLSNLLPPPPQSSQVIFGAGLNPPPPPLMDPQSFGVRWAQTTGGVLAVLCGAVALFAAALPPDAGT